MATKHVGQQLVLALTVGTSGGGGGGGGFGSLNQLSDVTITDLKNGEVLQYLDFAEDGLTCFSLQDLVSIDGEYTNAIQIKRTYGIGLPDLPQLNRCYSR